MSELDLLRTVGDQLTPPPLAALRETARLRTRRATMTGVGAAAAVALLVTGGSLLVASDRRGDPEPVGPPEPGGTSRPLVYANGPTVHYGDDLASTAPAPVVEVDVTDDGAVVRTADGGIWFTDGVDLEPIGELGEQGYVGEPPALVPAGWVVSGNTGSLVAWFEFPRPSDPVLVVYDTASEEVVVDRAAITVTGSRWSLPQAVTEHAVYWYTDPSSDSDPEPDARYDLASGAQTAIAPDAYRAEQPPRGTPRTMVVGNAEDESSYDVVDGAGWNFAIDDRRVTPQGEQPLVALDGGTGEPLRFRAPAGYPDNHLVWLVQWLDDDTVVLLSNQDDEDHLLRCRISTGECDLAVGGRSSIVAPDLG